MTIFLKKKKFLDKYNKKKTIDEAIRKGINASVQHNCLYASSIKKNDKIELKKVWKDLIFELSKKYKTSQQISTYESDIIQLQSEMNKNFTSFFRGKSDQKCKSDPGFRISHSQKSISVSLKHLWCLGEIKMPPQCPVDAVILGIVGKKYPDKRWGHVNSLDTHKEKMLWIEDAVSKYNQLPKNQRLINGSLFENGKDLSIAEWELAHFNP